MGLISTSQTAKTLPNAGMPAPRAQLVCIVLQHHYHHFITSRPIWWNKVLCASSFNNYLVSDDSRIIWGRILKVRVRPCSAHQRNRQQEQLQQWRHLPSSDYVTTTSPTRCDARRFSDSFLLYMTHLQSHGAMLQNAVGSSLNLQRLHIININPYRIALILKNQNCRVQGVIFS